MSQEEDRVRRKIKELESRPPRKADCPYNPYSTEGKHYDPFVRNPICRDCFADQILSIKGLRIEADNQSLPDLHYWNAKISKSTESFAADMLKDNWVKVIK